MQLALPEGRRGLPPLPFYLDASVALHWGSALDLLQSMDTNSVDHVITDPPYSKETHGKARTLKGSGKRTDKRTSIGNAGTQIVAFKPITEAELRLALEEMGRVARRWVIATLDWEHAAALAKRPPRGLRFVRCSVWLKKHAAPQITGDRPAMGWEAIAVMHKRGGRMRWNGGGHTANYIEPVVHSGRICTAQKPVELLKRIVGDFTDEGDLVLDPYAGSATTLVAAAELGRRAIGFEVGLWQAVQAQLRLARRGTPCSATSPTKIVTHPTSRPCAPRAAWGSSGAMLTVPSW